MLQSSEPSPGPRPLQSGAVDVPTRQRTPGPNSRTSEHPLKDSPLGRCIGASVHLHGSSRGHAGVNKTGLVPLYRRIAGAGLSAERLPSQLGRREEGRGGGGGGCVQKSARAETLLRPGPSLQQENGRVRVASFLVFPPSERRCPWPQSPKASTIEP